MIEKDADVWMPKRGFDDSRVEGGAADGIDVVPRIAVVRREMQFAGLVVDHPAGHRDCMAENFVGNAELFERVNPSGREREIDRAAANDVTFARIGPALVKFHLVSAPPEISRQHSASEPASNQDIFRHMRRIGESGIRESRKSCSRGAVSPREFPASTQRGGYSYGW